MILKIFNQLDKKKKFEEKEQREESFVSPQHDDAVVINSGGIVSQTFHFVENSFDEKTLINSWRELAQRPEIDLAIQEIVNEAIVTDFENFPVSISIPDYVDLPKKIRDKISDEFIFILGLLDFKKTSTEKFRQWYIDGKIYFHGILDSQKPTKGLVGIRWIDPRNIKKTIETEKEKNEQGIEIEKIKDIYYVYKNEKTNQIIKVHPSAIVYSNSGLFREKPDGSTFSISFLDKSLKVANQLKLLEDSVVIYRLSRAPEKRIFYIDVGDLPKAKAEQYLANIMNRFKNKMVYDSITGEVKNQKNIVSLLEDYWLPRREGGRGTEVTTLPGGQNLGELEDVEYFYKKLYRSLNIPISRIQSEGTFNLGRSSEITREEVKFAKFIQYLRSKFSEIFIGFLRLQLISKNIMNERDFDEISKHFSFKWKTDSYWDELKSNEMWQSRLSLLQQAEQYENKYFSTKWIKKNILMFSDEEIEEIQNDISNEKENSSDLEGNEEKNKEF